ncbi:MAG: ABC transporter permease subunit, partial [Lachnospiraceae bacterium]|nr:ABC transporter permease subunit [Lachnospiraceae bacterium]
RVDIVMQRVIDVLGSIPTLVVVTLMMVVMKPGIGAIILTLALTGWMDMRLIARSGVLSIKELEYVQAARTMGAGDLYIIRKEIMPNIIEHMLPQIMICVPNAVFLESFLSFAGLGLPVGECSLGTLLSAGFENVLLHPYKLIPCSVIMLLLMISCHLTAQGMEKVLN